MEEFLEAKAKRETQVAQSFSFVIGEPSGTLLHCN